MAQYVVITGGEQSQVMQSARSAVTYILDMMLWFGYRRGEIKIIMNKIKIPMISLIIRAGNEKGGYNA